MKPTKKQIEVLLLITPGPLGEGLKIKEVAEKLGISEIAVKKRLERFKRNHPDAWERFEGIRNVSRRERDNLHNHIWRITNLGETFSRENYFDTEESIETISYEYLEKKYKIRRKF